jgi:carbamoyltransferase
MNAARRPRWVLGVNPGPHDGSAALLCDGRLYAMAEQERFSRIKAAPWQPPTDAIASCLGRAGIGLDEVAGIALSANLDLLHVDERRAFHRTQPPHGRIDDPQVLFPSDRFPHRRLPPIHPYPHHLAHAASSFRISGYEEAAIVTLDDRGEDASATVAHGTPESIHVLARVPVEDSLGLYYRTASAWTGLGRATSQSGKLMGLAAYGTPNQPVPLHVHNGWPSFTPPPPAGPTPEVRRRQRTLQLVEFFTANCFPYRPGLHAEIMAYANFAASIQHALEQAIQALCEQAHQQTGSRRLCLAGGVALNCTSNGKLHQQGRFEHIFIPPAAHDAGASLGAALELDAQLTGHAEPELTALTHPYWGPAFTDEQIQAELRRAGLCAPRLDECDLLSQVAELLANHRVVGWFQGAAEIGPRALGARSILGNPTDRANLVRINQLKGREPWRPLAPSVTQEDFSRYFIGPDHCEFMLVACQVRPEHAAELQAVTHVDGTARPQTVSHATNPRFWKLLRAVEQQTGHPVVINTSYNLAGEPIVDTLAEAITDYLSSPMDALAIGDHFAVKPQRDSLHFNRLAPH